MTFFFIIFVVVIFGVVVFSDYYYYYYRYNHLFVIMKRAFVCLFFHGSVYKLSYMFLFKHLFLDCFWGHKVV